MPFSQRTVDKGAQRMNNNVNHDFELNLQSLRNAVREEYEIVATNPNRGFHFHTGRPLAQILGYKKEWIDGVPESAIESFAGTGNPFSLGTIEVGTNIVDIGCGAGIDSLIAARMTGEDGHVIGVDMTLAMLQKARRNAAKMELDHVKFREGYGEELPVSDEWADVVISNGVLNLMPDKDAGLQEMARVLKPNGRLQIGDILVEKAVPQSAKEDIDLWTG